MVFMPVILVIVKLRQEGCCEFQTSHSYKVSTGSAELCSEALFQKDKRFNLTVIFRAETFVRSLGPEKDFRVDSSIIE